MPLIGYKKTGETMGLLEKLQQMQKKEDTTESQPDITTRLQDIEGDGVNPPSEETEESTEGICSYCQNESDELDENGFCPECSAKEPCPHCNERFIHLAKHKCKLAKKSPPSQPIETPKPKASNVKWEFAKGETVLAVLPVKVLQQWGTDEDQRYHVAYQPNVGTSQQDPQPTVKFDVKDTQLSSLQNGKSRASSIAVNTPNERQSSEGFTLVIDAVGNFEDEVIEFSNFIDPFCQAVARENQVEYWSLVDYGKSPGFLASKVERFLSENLSELAGIVITADSDSPEFRACKEVLKRSASTIIQGIR